MLGLIHAATRDLPHDPGEAHAQWVAWVRRVGKIIATAAPGSFYGRVTLNFQGGKLVNIGVEESVRPE